MYLKRVFQLGALLWISIVTSSLIDGELGSRFLRDVAMFLEDPASSLIARL